MQLSQGQYTTGNWQPMILVIAVAITIPWCVSIICFCHARVKALILINLIIYSLILLYIIPHMTEILAVKMCMTHACTEQK